MDIFQVFLASHVVVLMKTVMGAVKTHGNTASLAAIPRLSNLNLDTGIHRLPSTIDAMPLSLHLSHRMTFIAQSQGSQLGVGSDGELRDGYSAI